MTQQPEQGATPESAAPERPGKRFGQVTEFTVIVPLKPGGAERTRERLKNIDQSRRNLVGTIHDARITIIDNDSRLLFASTFDGDWDSYMDDFASMMPDQLDALFADAEGYPGMRSPDIKDWFVKYQLEADDFYCDYPNTTVKQIHKGQRVLKAWEELLDTAAE
jgi:hypothetical protein